MSTMHTTLAPCPAQRPAPADPLAVGSLVAAVIAPPVGLVLGAVARHRLPSGRAGRGAASAAVAIGATLTALWIGLVALLILAGGSFSAGFTTASVPAAEVQQQIVAVTGLPDAAVSCPDDLPARVGASTVCTAATDRTTTPLDVSVTDVDGDDVGFRITSR